MAAAKTKVPKRAAQPQKYFTYKPSDPRSHLKIKAGQHAAFAKDLGWYAAAGKKPTVVVDVNRGGTSQNQSVIESPAQIEARVTRMAQAAYDRQKGDLDTESARMRKEAEGRRLGMIAAYQAAGNQNAEMASKVQDGWNVAANNLQGIAGATTGGIGDALRADTALQDQALARVGAGGTGFDATSQQGVEQYRGGALPAEYFTREGGIANEYLSRMPDNLKRMGLATADATERETLAKLAQDRLTQVRTLGENRTKYEEDLREQLLGARKDQMDALVDAQKALADAQSDAAKLEYQYWNARQNATTKKELQQVDMIYKNEKLRLQGLTDAALIAQRNASASASTALAGQRNANPTGAKPPSGASVSTGVVRANTAAAAAINQVFTNIWATVAPSMAPPAGWKAPASDPKMKYVDSPEYAAAYAKATKLSKAKHQAAFGTIMDKTIKAISHVMKPLGYTPAQIKQMAYEQVTQKVPAPVWWLKKTGRKLPAGNTGATFDFAGAFGGSKLPSTLT